jgi:hypothetical protein
MANINFLKNEITNVGSQINEMIQVIKFHFDTIKKDTLMKITSKTVN